MIVKIGLFAFLSGKPRRRWPLAANAVLCSLFRALLIKKTREEDAAGDAAHVIKKNNDANFDVG